MQDNTALRILLAGVGGQGTILAADLLAKTALASGYHVKLSEIHGMSQRGGSVTTVVNIGDVNAMVIGEGEADFLLAFETTEALRNLSYLSEQGKLYVNNTQIEPLPVLIGRAAMPHNPVKRLSDLGAVMVQADELAARAGSPKTANVVLLGALSTGLPFEASCWEEQIRHNVPSAFVDMNLAAFNLGREGAQ